MFTRWRQLTKCVGWRSSSSFFAPACPCPFLGLKLKRTPRCKTGVTLGMWIRRPRKAALDLSITDTEGP